VIIQEDALVRVTEEGSYRGAGRRESRLDALPTQGRCKILDPYSRVAGLKTQRQARTGVLQYSKFGSGIPVTFMTLGRVHFGSGALRTSAA
jgi:hypothetical protein